MEAVMKTKAKLSLSLLALGLLPLLAQAGHGWRDEHRGRGHNRDQYRNGDYARVVHVQPLLERVRYREPVQECWTEDRYRGDSYRSGYRSDPTGAAIVGGAVGAIVGSHIGRGDGRTAATLGGAVVGAALGSEIARNDARRGYSEPRYREVERCHTRHQERYDERIVGYRVTYDYNGRRQVTTLPYDPGRYLQVAVNVHPVR
jgi:uncharacterized protein YcfJ